jgi:hypothetical protein
LFPIEHMIDRICVLVKKDSNAKKEIYWCTKDSRLDQVYPQNNESKKESSFLNVKILHRWGHRVRSRFPVPVSDGEQLRPPRTGVFQCRAHRRPPRTGVLGGVTHRRPPRTGFFFGGGWPAPDHTGFGDRFPTFF